MKSLFKLMMVSLLTLQVAVAQKTVTGVVSDDQGMPLPGATVWNKEPPMEFQQTSMGTSASMLLRAVYLKSASSVTKLL